MGSIERWLPCSHISALWVIAIAQPLFDLLSRNPEFFLAHQADRADLLIVTGSLVLLMPLTLFAVTAVLGLAFPRGKRIATAFVIGVLAALIALQVAKRGGVDEGGSALVLASLAGVAVAVAYHRVAVIRAFLSVLSMAIVVVPGIFLFHPDIRKLLADKRPGSQYGSRPAAVVSQVPVVLMVFDEISLISLVDREGRIDSHLFPHLARLAHDGVWFRNATTVSDYTRWALPAIVSGRYPQPSAAPSSDDHPDSLFSMLGRSHDVTAIESVTDLCPRSVCGQRRESTATRMKMIAADLIVLYQHVVLPDDFTAHLPELTGGWAHFRTAGKMAENPPVRRAGRRGRRVPTPDDRMRAIEAFLSRLRPSDSGRPGVYFLHSLLSHSPYWLLPSGQLDGTRSDTEALRLPNALPGKARELWTDDEWAVAQAHQRALQQLGFVDVILGRVVDHLKAAGLYESSLLIVTSDHGSAYRPGSPRRDFTEETAAQIMRVPLILKLPSTSASVIRGTVDVGGQNVSDRNVQTIDLVPTIADVLGTTVPWQAHGTSLVGAMDEPATKTMFYDSARRRRDYDRKGPDMSADLQRQVDTFGGAENPYRAPRPREFAELIGQETSRLRITDGGCATVVDFLSDFSRMNKDAPVVAFEFGGRFEGPLPRNHPPFLALAVNGTIRAVTKGWRAAPREFLATPPLDAWRNGENRIDVFAIQPSDGGPVLRKCTVREGRSH